MDNTIVKTIIKPMPIALKSVEIKSSKGELDLFASDVLSVISFPQL